MKRLRALVFLAAVCLLPMLSTKANALITKNYTFTSPFTSDTNWYRTWTPALSALLDYDVRTGIGSSMFTASDFDVLDGGKTLRIHPNSANDDTLSAPAIDGTIYSYMHTAVTPNLKLTENGFPVTYDFEVTLDASNATRNAYAGVGNSTNKMSFYSFSINEIACDYSLSPLSESFLRDQMVLDYSSWETGTDFSWTLHRIRVNTRNNPFVLNGGSFNNWPSQPHTSRTARLTDPRLRFKFHTQRFASGGTTLTVSYQDSAGTWVQAWDTVTLYDMVPRWNVVMVYPVITAKYGENPAQTDYFGVENMQYTAGEFSLRQSDGFCLGCSTTAVACTTDASCDDGNPATVDVCNGINTCGTSCEHTGSCVPACAANADCDDSNPATTDTCDLSGACAVCAHAPQQACCTNPITAPLTSDAQGIIPYTFTNAVDCSKVHVTLSAPSAGSNPDHLCIQVETGTNVWGAPIASVNPAETLSGGRTRYTFELDPVANTVGAHRLRYSKPGSNGCL